MGHMETVSGAILFAQRNFMKIKITPNTPKNESEPIQLIMMGDTIHQLWVKGKIILNCCFSLFVFKTLL